MEGKRYTTEEKILILREASSGKTVLEVCPEQNDFLEVFIFLRKNGGGGGN